MSFDSNAWEQVFDGPTDTDIHRAIRSGRIQAMVCETAFRIEAVKKTDRPEYFAQPHMGIPFEIVEIGGSKLVKFSIGPDDARHPGLPSQQAEKLRRALSAGVRVMRGSAWLGLPVPPELKNPEVFVPDPPGREQRHLDVTSMIDARGVGKAAFDAAGGWTVKAAEGPDQKRLAQACAEWADGELVAAHVAYGNDILCTNDRARASRWSVFNLENRHWLTEEFSVVFMSVDELDQAIRGRDV